MIQLVRDTNAKLGTATRVTCFTCHRGETRPALELPTDESDNGPLFEPLLALCVAEGDDVAIRLSIDG